jgi:hypothetical protein
MTEGPRLSRPAAPRGGPSAPRRGGGRPRVERQAKINRVDPYFGSTLTVSNRDSQSNCWVNLKLMGQPCEFQSIALARGVGVARIARAGSPRLIAALAKPSRRRDGCSVSAFWGVRRTAWGSVMLTPMSFTIVNRIDFPASAAGAFTFGDRRR